MVDLGTLLDDDAGMESRHVRGRRARHLGVVMVGILFGTATAISGVARRIGSGWQPQGDNAAIAWLTHDVFTTHIPLLGMPSTIGGPGSTSAYHWGPLLFWSLAVPDWLAGHRPVGLQIGLLLIALASVTGIVVFANRRVGALGALTLLVMLSIVSWSLGWHLLSSIWNPNIAILPLACVLVLSWSVAAGDHFAAPFLVLAASFVVQCNILYTPLVAALIAWSMIGLFFSRRDRRRDDGVRSRVRDPSPERSLDRRQRRSWIAAALVLVICWSGPLIYELSHSPGNFEVVVSRSQDDAGTRIGIERATDAMVHAVGVVPLWSRRLSTLADAGELLNPGSLATTGSAVAIGLMLFAGWWWVWRRDPVLRALLGTAVFGLGGATIGLAGQPLLFGATYRMWSLWLVGMFAWFAVIMMIGRTATQWWPRVVRVGTYRRAFVPVATVLGVMLVGVTASSVWGGTPAFLREPENSRVVSELVRETRRSLPKGVSYLAVQHVAIIGSGVLWGLERRGYDLRVTSASPFDDPYLGSEHGPGVQPLTWLYFLADPSTSEPTRPGRLIASAVSTASSTARGAYAAARRTACRSFGVTSPQVTRRGEAMLAHTAGGLDTRLLAGFKTGSPPCPIFEFRRVQRLIDGGAVRLNAEQVATMLDVATAYVAAQTHRYEVRVGPAPPRRSSLRPPRRGGRPPEPRASSGPGARYGTIEKTTASWI